MAGEDDVGEPYIVVTGKIGGFAARGVLDGSSDGLPFFGIQRLEKHGVGNTEAIGDGDHHFESRIASPRDFEKSCRGYSAAFGEVIH